jgi:hypothetical protein
MIDDPIVAEVRAIREKLAAECGFDIRRIVERARIRQAQSGARIVSFERKVQDAAGKKTDTDSSK